MPSARNILVTGGTRGLGLAFVRRLVSLGHNIAVTDISNRACSVYDELPTGDDLICDVLSYSPDPSKSEVIVNYGDLTSQAVAEEIITWAWDRLGHIDVVVANAGGDIVGTDMEASGRKPQKNNSQISFSQHEEIFDRNYLTCWNTVTKMAPLMAGRGFGKIITLSSVNASFGMQTETVYSVAKAAVVHLTRAMAAEWREMGISSNCLMLGPTRSGRFQATLEQRSPHDLEAFSATGRLTRIADIEDAANVLEFLVEEKSDYISGQIIRVDGGRFPQPL